MAALTFSAFANILYPYCGHQNKNDFVITLTDKIMCGRPGRAIKAKSEDEPAQHQNPMRDKSADERTTYLSGKRGISAHDASLILGRIDRYKFECYMRTCSDDALSLIEADLYEHQIKRENADDKRDTAELCADLFVEILKERAASPQKAKTK